MRITKKRGIAMVMAAATLAAAGSLVASPAFAATSTGSVYLVDYTDGTTLPASNNWATASISLSTNPTGFVSGFVVPANTATTQAFLATPGTEDNVAGWLGSQPATPTGLSNAAPDTLTDNPSVSGDFHTLLQQGGTFSLGIAFVGSDNSYKGGYFTAITIAAGSPLMTYTPPAAPTAPVVTTSPADTSKVVGQTATFTAAATGTPTPTVQWQSAPSGTTTWTDLTATGSVTGVATNTLSIANVQAADNGRKFRAVYTSGSLSTPSSAAVLTVTFAAPTQPTGTDAGGSRGNVNVPSGQTTVPFQFTGGVVPAGTYGAWAWSTPTQLPNATVDGSGNVVFNIAGLPAGTHTLALVSLTTNQVVGWITIVIAQPTNTSAVALTVDVTTTQKFALEGVASALYLGSAARGATTTPVDLPAFTVTDDRDSLPGWDLTSNVANFVNDGVAVAANAGDVIDKGALKVTPHKVGGTIAGISEKPLYTASASNLFAEGLANSSTPSTGTQFNASLAFTVPTTAKKGTYASTLTLTLTSK